MTNIDIHDELFYHARKIFMVAAGLSDGKCFFCGISRDTCHSYPKPVIYEKHKYGNSFKICSRCINSVRISFCAYAKKTYGDISYLDDVVNVRGLSWESIPNNFFALWTAGKLMKKIQHDARR